MKSKFLIAALFVMPLLLMGCWSGTCDDEGGPLCDTCTVDQGCFNEHCEPAQCRSDLECHYMEYCNEEWGRCFPSDIECLFDWECPEGSLCAYNAESGMNACTNPNPDNACFSDWDCPEHAYCDEFTGLCRSGQECQTSADCPTDTYCDARNTCSPRPAGPCRNDSECGQGAYCEDGTCVNSSLCQGDEDCTDPAAPVCDLRGSCVAGDTPITPCQDNSSCDEGKVCVDGFCEDEAPRDPSQNCLVNEHCGEHGICVDGRCYGACVGPESCGTGEVCGANGFCEESDVPGGECHSNSDCALPGATCINGTCHDSCTDTESCSNTHDHCVEGICVPNDVVRPQCYTNNDCSGGEECFQGVCRVPCQDAADCAACPGNPICGVGGYCMDNNDVNPECTLSEDCASGFECVDALCVN